MTRCARCQRRLPPSGDCPIHGRPTGVVSEAATAPDVAAPPGWQIERQLATGGTAHVFVVRHVTGAPAILKWGRWRERDIYLRFELEAKLLAAVGPAWTAALIDCGVSDGWPYILMELLAGETLAAWMARSGERGGLGEILALLDQVAAGLGAIHAAGIVHRDLKPENVVIGPRGVRLIDFGLARQPEVGGLTQIGAVVGTVHYLAPEQVRGEAVDHRADLYSFGVVGFEMLCGRPPFVGERRAIEYQHTLCRPPAVRESRSVPEELDALIAACLAKQPEARPQTAADVRAWLARSAGGASTARGVSPGALGVRGRIALLWTSGADPVAVVRAVGDVSGLVVRQRGDSVLAAFTGLDHDAPLPAALAAAQALALGGARGRSVIHLGAGLLRRSVQGKIAVYGDDVEHVERWLPPPPYGGLASGILLTAAAAELAPDAVPSPDVPGFFRPGRRDRTGKDDARAPTPLRGRSELIDSLVAVATQAVVDGRPVHVAIAGDTGAGKTRVLDAICDRLRAAGHEVIALRGRRRFPGEPHGELLGGGEIAAAAARGAVIAIDDASWLAPAALRALDRTLAGGATRLAVITASAAPVGDRDAPHRVDVALRPLAAEDAELLVRELLRPARLVPAVLVERLVIRAGGNPGLLVALAGEITRRGAIRRQVGSDEWYVAADELDTLLAAPSPAWFAVRTLEDLPGELQAVVRTCAALGPRFSADEIAQVHGGDLAAGLAWLVRDCVLERSETGGGDPDGFAGGAGGRAPRGIERSEAGAGDPDGGWYAFCDPAIQDAIVDLLDDREPVHGRAFQYWAGRPGVTAIERLTRLAFHGAGAHEPITAATCWIALARAAHGRGELDDAERLLDRAIGSLTDAAPRLRAATLLERARLRYARGRFAATRDDARSARRAAEQIGHAEVHAAAHAAVHAEVHAEVQIDALAIEALAATAAGDPAAASAAITAAVALDADDVDVAVRARILAAIGLDRVRAGQPDAAAPALQLAAALAEVLGDPVTAAAVAQVLRQPRRRADR
ncbi:MAG TPA: protein kinase [Kofleriaceae bacterium]|nr:protein kinase [Kofleriaceae bacterium]